MKYTNRIAKSCEVEISRDATRVNGRRGIECVEVELVGVWATLPFSDKFCVNDSKVEQRIGEGAGSNIHNPYRSRVDRVRPNLDPESCDVSDVPPLVIPWKPSFTSDTYIHLA